MVVEKPRLIFESQTNRRKHMKRFLLGILGAVGGFGAYVVLTQIEQRADVPPLLIRLGEVFALGVFVTFAVRALFALARGFRLKTETIRFFDRGLMWAIGDDKYKYSWGQLASYREAFKQIKLGKRVIFQRGAVHFTMADGQRFALTPPHGDLKKITDQIRPIIAELLGTRMGRLLRDGQTVPVHKQISLANKGIRAGKEAIHWKQVDVAVKGGKLIISRKDKMGRFVPVMKVPVAQVENLDGFIDVATSVMQNYQPERFGVETQVGKVYYEESRR